MVASIVDPDLLYGQVAQIIPERMFFGSLKSTPKADPNVRFIFLNEKVSLMFSQYFS